MRMTIEETIKLYEEGAKSTWNGKPTVEAEECQQIAEWLKDYNRLLVAVEKIKNDIREEKECAYADFEQYKIDYLSIDPEYVLDDLPNDDFRYGMERALEIIRKLTSEGVE